MGCLLGWAGALGGGGRGGRARRRGGWPGAGSHYTGGTFPQREAEGTGAAGGGGGLGTQGFQFPCLP